MDWLLWACPKKIDKQQERKSLVMLASSRMPHTELDVSVKVMHLTQFTAAVSYRGFGILDSRRQHQHHGHHRHLRAVTQSVMQACSQQIVVTTSRSLLGFSLRRILVTP